MVMGQDLISLLAGDIVDDIVGTEILLNVENGLQDDDQHILTLYLRLGMQTVIAISAVILWIGLTEIMQQHLSSADGGLGVSSRLHQELSPNILFSHRLTFHELVQFLQILV